MSDLIDFFISYNKADRQWAEWIAWELEEAGYTMVLQDWDFRPVGDLVIDRQRTIANVRCKSSAITWVKIIRGR